MSIFSLAGIDIGVNCFLCPCPGCVARVATRLGLEDDQVRRYRSAFPAREAGSTGAFIEFTGFTCADTCHVVNILLTSNIMRQLALYVNVTAVVRRVKSRAVVETECPPLQHTRMSLKTPCHAITVS